MTDEKKPKRDRGMLDILDQAERERGTSFAEIIATDPEFNADLLDSIRASVPPENPGPKKPRRPRLIVNNDKKDDQ